jgi:hypothetical protein
VVLVVLIVRKGCFVVVVLGGCWEWEGAGRWFVLCMVWGRWVLTTLASCLDENRPNLQVLVVNMVGAWFEGNVTSVAFVHSRATWMM